MKALRIVQIVLLVLAAVYLVLVHNANPTNVDLLFAIPVPPAVALAAALLVGWLVGWLPSRIRLWRRERELARLTRRVRELQEHLPSYDGGGTPVIPDRDPARPGAGGARGVAARLLRRGRPERKPDEIEPQS